jgi:hypothetical protein
MQEVEPPFEPVAPPVGPVATPVELAIGPASECRLDLVLLRRCGERGGLRRPLLCGIGRAAYRHGKGKAQRRKGAP